MNPQEQFIPEEQIEKGRASILAALQDIRMPDWIVLLLLDSIRGEILAGSRAGLLQQSIQTKTSKKKGKDETEEMPIHTPREAK